MKTYNFSYDKEQDDLFIYDSSSKSKGSVEIGDIILDFNSRKELVGLQILNASSMIKDLTDEDTTDFLDRLTGCSIDIIHKNRMLIIKLFLQSNSKKMTPVLSVPDISETSPALAYG